MHAAQGGKGEDVGDTTDVGNVGFCVMDLFAGLLLFGLNSLAHRARFSHGVSGGSPLLLFDSLSLSLAGSW